MAKVKAKSVEPKLTRWKGEEITPLYQGVILRAVEFGVPWFLGDPVVEWEGSHLVAFEGHMRNAEDIRADIRVALKRETPRRPRGRYLRFSVFMGGEVTLYVAPAPDRPPNWWRVGWSWRNPSDTPLAKRGRAEARANSVLVLFPKGAPSWASLIKFLVKGVMTGDVELPAWFHRGGIASHLECTCELFDRGMDEAKRQSRKTVVL